MPPEALLLPAVRSELRPDENGGLVAFPPVRSVLGRVATFARARWHALSAAIFVAAVAAVALIAATVSDLNWDLLAYTAVVFEDTIDTPEALHAASFGAVHLAAMHYLRDRTPPELHASAQGFYAALGTALPFGLLTPVAGWVFGVSGGTAFWAMAAIALAGTAVAEGLSKHLQ